VGVTTKRLFEWARTSWFIFGITLFLLLLVELTLTFVYRWRVRNDEGSRLALADAYHGADWTQAYYSEDEESGMRWEPYVYWTRKPYRGRFINVDSNGVRRTWRPATPQDVMGRSPRVFLLGGSTMWGTGARDEFTIPLMLAKKLAASGIDANITNYGQSGYVSTQEVILLIRLIQAGKIPDLVVFYDGVNDVYSGFQQGRAGLPQNEFNRVAEFGSSATRFGEDNWTRLRDDGLRFVLHASVGRLARAVSSRGRGAADQETGRRAVGHGADPANPGDEAIAEEVVSVYKENMSIVGAIAVRYSFKVLFYWQPSIFFKRHLTEYERSRSEEQSGYRPVSERVRKVLLTRELPTGGEIRFFDISTMFADVPEPLFVDHCHLGETGNGRVADRLFADVSSAMGWRGSDRKVPEGERTH
jgi:hypothetical protein